MKHIRKLLTVVIMTALVLTMTVPNISENAYAATSVPSAYIGTVAKQIAKYGKAGSEDQYGNYSAFGVQTIDIYDLDGDKKSELVIVRLDDSDTANLSVWTNKSGKVKRITNETFDIDATQVFGTTVGLFKYKGKKYAGYSTADMANGIGSIHLYHYLYGSDSAETHEEFGNGIEYGDIISEVKTLEVYMETGGGGNSYWIYNNDAVDNVNEISQKSAIKKKITIAGIEATTIKASTSLTSAGKIKVAWTKSKGYKVDYFEVYRSTSKNGTYKKIYTSKSGTASSYTDKSVKNGTKYYYKVRGVRKISDKNYYTEWSNKANRTAKKLSSNGWVDLYRAYLKDSKDLQSFVCLSDIKGNDGIPELLVGGFALADSYITEMVYISDGKLKVEDYLIGGGTTPYYTEKKGDVLAYPSNWRDDVTSYMTDSEINEFLSSWK